MERIADDFNRESSKARKTQSNKSVLKTRFITDVHELAKRLELSNIVTPEVEKAAAVFPIRFPESLLNRVQKGNPHDPILTQFFPSARELEKTPGFSNDPLCEQAEPSTGENKHDAPCVMQKYAGRALVITTNACACACRFCFRRFFPKNRALFPLAVVPSTEQSNQTNDVVIRSYFDSVFESIRKNGTISELIFSGGDPLTLSNASLKILLHYISSISHVKRVRFHTRVPILVPDRIDEEFPSLKDFQVEGKLPPFVLHIVLHVNSPNEIDEKVAKALFILRQKGYILTSQSTLLRGVNDSADVLAQLYEKLIDNGVVPYYLHQLDRVQGAAHFETPVPEGREIIKELCAKVPGYANPQYVREVPGRPMKTNLFIDRTVD